MSFTEASTPLLQFDFAMHAELGDLANQFPEGIVDNDSGSVWVYGKTTLPFDICIVLTEATAGSDWAPFLEGCRVS